MSRYVNKAKFIRLKAHYLMIPYLFFSIFSYAAINFALNIDKTAQVLESGGYAKSGFFDALFSILTYNNHTDQHLWFLYALFIVFVVNILFPKLSKHPAAIAAMLALYISKAFAEYFGIIDYVVSDLLFFAVGRVAADNKLLKDSLKKCNLFALIALFVICNSFYSYLYTSGLPDNELFIAVLYCFRAMVSLLGIASVCRVAMLLEKTRLAKPLKSLGGYSYDIYLMHAPFIVSGSMGILLSYSSVPKELCCMIALIGGIAVPIILSKLIIRRISLLSSIILGKSYKQKPDKITRTEKL
ncbi:MAG: acyltransferase [Oscillospiraceae bacterium]|nr:acyltransferase [Oscillospiraceae bacterium]